MSLYDDKYIKPMLIGLEQSAFDSEDYIFELKLDGVRCIAYIDENKIEFRNKRNLKLNDKFPELLNTHQQVNAPCILDGELYVYKDGKTDFFEIQKRTLMDHKFKIKLLANKLPATFTAFDVLYYKGKDITKKPLLSRKKILSTLIKENNRINISRYIEKEGIQFFKLTKEQGLEGIVAKHKNSKYYLDTRTKDWIKCKNMIDDDFIITGYIPKEKGMVSLILAKYNHNQLIYKGHVTLGVSSSYLKENTKKSNDIVFDNKENKQAIWIYPYLVGTVKYMEKTANGSLRQPVFKGFRNDKLPFECIDYNNHNNRVGGNN